MKVRIGMLDIVAAVVVVVVVVLPTPTPKIHAFYEGRTLTLAPELAAAQSDVLRDPHDRAALERFADVLVRAGQSDWALRVVGEKEREETPDRYRQRMLLSVVHAERLEVGPALSWAKSAIEACDAPGSSCQPFERVRLELYKDALQAGADSGIDPAADPKGFEGALQNANPVIHVGPR